MRAAPPRTRTPISSFASARCSVRPSHYRQARRPTSPRPCEVERRRQRGLARRTRLSLCTGSPSRLATCQGEPDSSRFAASRLVLVLPCCLDGRLDSGADALSRPRRTEVFHRAPRAPRAARARIVPDARLTAPWLLLPVAGRCCGTRPQAMMASPRSRRERGRQGRAGKGTCPV